MTHASVFSGQGGFDLAADLLGWENLFHCEIDPFPRHVLKYYWPKATSYADITQTDFTIWRGRVNVLSGGFPCQPFSKAGRRTGVHDSRYLWPQMCRAIWEIQPDWVVAENVPGILNWSKGMVFYTIKSDLEAAGYESLPFVLPACGTNAPHKRERFFLVAHRKRPGLQESETQAQHNPVQNAERNGLPDDDAYLIGKRCEASEQVRRDAKKTRKWGKGLSGADPKLHFRPDWDNWPTVSPFCTGVHGLPGELDGIAFPTWRRSSIKAAGNAVVPHLVLQIFKTIQQVDHAIHS